MMVSGFLTGRDIRDNMTTSAITIADYADDSTGVFAEDNTDKNMTGLFYVSDPAGRTYPGTGLVRKWGYNDLERRAQDLSNFVTSSCLPIISVGLLEAVSFQPLNMVH
jgi:hypothetical protein